MFTIHYEEEPGKEEYSQSFWQRSAGRREKIFVALGVSEPYFYNGRWCERFSLINPLTWLFWIISSLINAVVSGAVAAAVTTHLMLLAEHRLPKAAMRSFRSAPLGKPPVAVPPTDDSTV